MSIQFKLMCAFPDFHILSICLETIDMKEDQINNITIFNSKFSLVQARYLPNSITICRV